MTASHMANETSTTIPLATGPRCDALMANLALHPLGGPWVCLTCKGETQEAAVARYTPESRGKPI